LSYNSALGVGVGNAMGLDYLTEVSLHSSHPINRNSIAGLDYGHYAISQSGRQKNLDAIPE
jgi:hypothetical protein